MTDDIIGNGIQIPPLDPLPAISPVEATKPVHHGTANLIPFEPGKSGNPAGKKPGTLNRKTLYLRLLQAAAVKRIAERQNMELGVDHDAAPTTIAEQLAAMVVIKALDGDMGALDRVFDNAFDKLTENHSVTSNSTVRQVLDEISAKPKGLPKLDDEGEQCTTTSQTPKP